MTSERNNLFKWLKPFIEAILVDENELETRDDIESFEVAINVAVSAMEFRKFDVFVCYEKLGGNWDVFKNRYRIAGSKCVYDEDVRDYLSSDYAGRYSEMVMKDVVDSILI